MSPWSSGRPPGPGVVGGPACGSAPAGPAGASLLPYAPDARFDGSRREPPPLEVSVVVPTCGRPALLGRCLEALCAQCLPSTAYEILVVDDGRSDATRREVERIAKEVEPLQVRYLRPNGRHGPAAARNCGWRASRAQVIAFTDDDAVPAPEWLPNGLRAMRSHREAALAGRVVVPLPAHRRPTDHERMTQGLERAEFATANAFVRRSTLIRIDGFDERFECPWREDSDLQFRIEGNVGPVGRCDEAVVLHPVRREPWGVSLRQQKNVFFDALLFRKHPLLYRSRLRSRPPWDYYLIVALCLATLVLAAYDIAGSAWISGLLAVALIVRLAAHRLRRTTLAPAHVAEMLLTSALIPFLSVYWRLRGAWHFRVWFL